MARVTISIVTEPHLIEASSLSHCALNSQQRPRLREGTLTFLLILRLPNLKVREGELFTQSSFLHKGVQNYADGNL